MISEATLLAYDLPSGRAMQRDGYITIPAENGGRVHVPVQVAERPLVRRIDWLAVTGFAFAAAIAAWGMWGGT